MPSYNEASVFCKLGRCLGVVGEFDCQILTRVILKSRRSAFGHLVTFHYSSPNHVCLVVHLSGDIPHSLQVIKFDI